MKILIISKYASSIEVGFESRIFSLARRFVKFGHKVSIISSDSNHFGIYPNYNKTFNFEKVDGISLLRICTLKYKKTVSISRILSWLDFELKLFFLPINKIEKPDVIIISSLSLLTIMNGVRLKNKYNAKLIFEIRDIWPLAMVEESGFSKWNPFVIILGFIEKYGYKMSDLVVGTMPNLREHVINITDNTNINCVCVPFGFDETFYKINKVDSESFRNKYNISQNRFIIGYAGSIGISNGLDAFIECSKKMSSDDRFLFILLGDGDLRESYIKQTNKQTNIIFISKIKREDVASFLNLCNLLYFASKKSKIWDFGWSPNKLIDYMMAGKPVLASYSGFQSMLNEAGSGFFIQSEDTEAIIDMLEKIICLKSEDMEKMGIAGREWIMKNRNWDSIASYYIELLNNI